MSSDDLKALLQDDAAEIADIKPRKHSKKTYTRTTVRLDPDVLKKAQRIIDRKMPPEVSVSSLVRGFLAEFVEDNK